MEAGARASAATLASQLATWKAAANPLVQAGIGVHPVRGNHEADAADSAATWRAAFSGTWAPPGNGPAGEEGLSYAFSHNNALFVGLDCYVNPHQVNQAWLDQQLTAKVGRPHVFVFGHEPAFKVFHSDCLDDYPDARDAFWRSLQGAGARVAFAGHDHFFDHARLDDGDGDPADDVTQMVVGSGGGSLFESWRYIGDNGSWTPNNLDHRMAHGYLLVEVSGAGAADLGLTCTFKERRVAGDGTVSFASVYTWTTSAPARQDYPVVGTAQTACYDATQAIPAPAPGMPFHGQDAQHASRAPRYRDNGDGTVSDLVTGLMWVQARGDKLPWAAAVAAASACRVGGHSDWRMPSIKELYSLIAFTGAQGSSMTSLDGYVPFIDTGAFDFRYGTPGSSTVGDRVIDCQDWSGTAYVGTTMVNAATAFGVNFADGRIKGYPQTSSNHVRYVRGNPGYGVNHFQDNGDGTVTDAATGLMWTQADSGAGLDWEAALAWVQARNAEGHLGHSDWRLPDAKELHTLLDTTRAPQATDPARRGPAIDPRFLITAIPAEGGATDYPYFWTSTSFHDGSRDMVPAAYHAFGRALGWMKLGGASTYTLVDAHGAGAQRSDPKTGAVSAYLLGTDASGQPVYGRGPQGDVVRIQNFVRMVRTVGAP